MHGVRMDTANKLYVLKNNMMYTNLTGVRLLNAPFLNKETAFSAEERMMFHLLGLLPPHIEMIEAQEERAYDALHQKTDPLEKHIYLRQLQDRNETLFYYLVIKHLEEIMPLIYTPTVGLACERFSRIYRHARGLFLAYPERKYIMQALENSPSHEVKVIVVTDGERILGLGDQGAGGMGISIGKLSLYSACGGINPVNTLPILLDVGTNNDKLHADPTYIGWRHQRITGDEYFEFVDEFVQAVIKKYPQILLQFEDFAQAHAYPLLEKYRDRLCCFNDDIQGTAAVTVGALISAIRKVGNDFKDHRVAVLGAGSAGCGISELLVKTMMHSGMSEQDARSRFYMVDRNGLLLNDMPGLLPFQKNLTQPRSRVAGWKLKKDNFIGLADVVHNAKPTILLGVSAQPKQFTQDIVEEMLTYTKQPIIMPMSNPNERCEAMPADLINWTQGEALIATGSPFEPVNFASREYAIAQCNNCYIFPGMGLGVIAVGSKRVTDEMFMAAAIALSDASPALHTKGGPLLPPLKNIREVSENIAIAVAKQAMKQGLAPHMVEEELMQRVHETMWQPKYYQMQLQK